MSFLAPALLLGLGLLAIPVLVHLTRRQRSQVTPFPSLMFLRKVPFRTTRRRRIRHPLLFALRCLAVVLIAVAFARPFLSGSTATAETGARDVVLLLDVSGSMASGPRLAAARDAARRVLGELGEADRAALVTFDDRATERAALGSNLAGLVAALESLPRTDRPTRVESGLQLAGRILDGSDRAVREVVLISDFQRTGWEDGGRTRLPDGVALRTVRVGEAAANLAVGSVRVSPGAGGRHRVLARVLNLGDAPVEDLAATFELGGRVVGTRPVRLEARGAASVLFEDVAIPPGAPLGRVRLGPGGGEAEARGLDALDTDDELRFVAAPEPVVDVVLVDAPRGRADRSLFLVRALELAERPGLRVTRRQAGALDGAALERAGVVVLNDAAPGNAPALARLRDWVSAGGALVVALGPESGADRWAGADSTLLGGRVGEVADHAARAGSRLAWIDYDHPAFDVFSSPGSGDFSAARFWRFRRFEAGPDARVLARFEDGEPALVEHGLGDGRVLTWTSTLDRFWNDLALQPVYLPFVHRTVRHAADFAEPERWLEAGAARELARLLEETPGGAADVRDPEMQWVLATPGDERVPVGPGEDGGPAWIEFDRAGFYRVEPVDGGGPSVPVAVNLPPRESDLGAIAPEQLAAAVVGGPGASGRADPSAAVSGADAGTSGQAAGPPGHRELWWPLLLLAAMVLTVESWLANRWSAPRPAASSGTGKETLR